MLLSLLSYTQYAKNMCVVNTRHANIVGTALKLYGFSDKDTAPQPKEYGVRSLMVAEGECIFSSGEVLLKRSYPVTQGIMLK